MFDRVRPQKLIAQLVIQIIGKILLNIGDLSHETDKEKLTDLFHNKCLAWISDFELWWFDKDFSSLLTRSWGGDHPYKHLRIFQKWFTVRIWDFLTFNIYYLGPFSQNFRSVSLFLRKLEPFCRGWLEKFCLVAKIQHFLPYLKTQIKS